MLKGFRTLWANILVFTITNRMIFVFVNYKSHFWVKTLPTIVSLLQMTKIFRMLVLKMYPTHNFERHVYLRLRRIWSRTHLNPGLPVPDFLSPWTNDPHKIDPPGQTVPIKFGPHGQMVPNQFGPPGQMVPRIFCLSRGTSCDDLEIWGPNWLGTICPGGPKSLGTIC